jgi:hypothetical protein
MDQLQQQTARFAQDLRTALSKRCRAPAGCLITYAWAAGAGQPKGRTFSAVVTFPDDVIEPRPICQYPGVTLGEEWVTVDDGLERCRAAASGEVVLGADRFPDRLSSLNHQWYSSDDRSPNAMPENRWSLAWSGATQSQPADRIIVASRLPPLATARSGIAGWCGARFDSRFDIAPGQWNVVVHDDRARLADVSWGRGKCTILVECRTEATNLDLQYLFLDPQNRSILSEVVPLSIGTSAIDIPAEAASLIALIVGPNDEHLDQRTARRVFVPDAPVLSFEEAAMKDIYGGENERVEFKRWWDGKDANYSKQLVKTYAALANTEGGRLYFGVHDDRAEPEGTQPLCKRMKCSPLDAATRQYEELRNLFADRLENAPRFVHTIEPIKGEYVVRFEIECGGEVPCMVDKELEIWVRRGSSVRQLHLNEYAAHFKRRPNDRVFTRFDAL